MSKWLCHRALTGADWIGEICGASRGGRETGDKKVARMLPRTYREPIHGNQPSEGLPFGRQALLKRSWLASPL